METELGGQAIYLMRVFRFDGDQVIPKPLENTPDIARLSADAALKARLVDYVRGHLAEIDRGVYQLPDAFLAEKALSFSTFGSARTANHPFAALFTPADFAGLPYESLGYVASPAGLIARLDDNTCTGCHQGAATAGFHLIGYDQPGTSPLNVVKIPLSPHLHADDARRRAYLAALGAGHTPDPFRPLSIAPPADWSRPARAVPGTAAATMACLAPQDEVAFCAGWRCGEGLSCEVIALNPRLPVGTGQCMPKRSSGLVSGMACLSGALVPGSAPYLDRFRIVRQINSPAASASPSSYTCRPAKLGVPGGSAYRQCTAQERAFTDSGHHGPMREICAFVGGKAFDLCVATDNFAKVPESRAAIVPPVATDASAGRISCVRPCRPICPARPAWRRKTVSARRPISCSRCGSTGTPTRTAASPERAVQQRQFPPPQRRIAALPQICRRLSPRLKRQPRATSHNALIFDGKSAFGPPPSR